jgi:hypothetical protein
MLVQAVPKPSENWNIFEERFRWISQDLHGTHGTRNIEKQ